MFGDFIQVMSNTISTVTSSSVTSRPAAESVVAMVSTNAAEAVHAGVTTTLMVACENEDIDDVRELLSTDEVRANSTYINA